VGGMNESYQALADLLSVREQVEERSSRAKSNAKLVEALERFGQQCAELAGERQSRFYGVPSRGRQNETFSTLNQHYSSVLAVVSSADVRPTTQATAAFVELQRSAEMLQKSWNMLLTKDIPELNEQLQKAGLPPIDPHKPPAEKPGGSSDDEDEP